MIPLIAILAAAQLGKSLLVDKPQADRERALKAETQRYSPFSGLSDTHQIKEADPMGAVLGGAGQGLMLDQALGASEDKNNFNKRYLDIMEKQGGQGMPQNQWMYPQRPGNDYGTLG